MRTAAESYKKLMRFVSKNTAIPEGMSRIRAEFPEMLESLKEKIIQDTISPTDDIFSHPDCELFILALLHSNEIPTMKAYCLLEYVQILRQHSELQELRPDDVANFKKTDVDYFFSPHTVSTITTTLSYRFSAAGYPMPAEKINAAYDQLQGCERWIFFMDYSKVEKDGIINELEIFPWLVPSDDKKWLCYLSPAFNLKILQLFNPNCPVKIQHVFGSIKPETLTRSIQSGFRPITLYSKYVSSNPKIQHKSKAGPTIFTLHDWYHVSAMYFLLQRDDAFELVFRILEPALHQVLDNKTAKMISDDLGDLNIANFDFLKYAIANGTLLRPTCLEHFLRYSIFLSHENDNHFLIFFQLYLHFFTQDKPFFALHGKTIKEMLRLFIAEKYFINPILGQAVMNLFEEKMDALFSQYNDQASYESLRNNGATLDRRIKLAQKEPSVSSLELVKKELMKTVFSIRENFGSFFAKRIRHYGPFADRLHTSDVFEKNLPEEMEKVKSAYL